MSDTAVPVDLEAFAALARARRTSLLVDQHRPVAVELIARLCELAVWAPNHKRTWPWRFALFTGEGRELLGQCFAADMAEHAIGDETKRTKTLTKYRRAPAVVVVGCEAHEHPSFHAENRDAVAAGVQNLLLGATAAGLVSFWSTAPVIDGSRALGLCGFDTATRIIAVIYLGWPGAETPPAPQRPVFALDHISSAAGESVTYQLPRSPTPPHRIA